ncbi:hypothetical protein E8D34_11030 [Nocardioides sp. GY 10113]|uniref:hypothetical protein n=1 Tax=Nocardioides sp. GY 10113 TaxID=2569761 RepID=UPI0010A7F285|nr:hypothetical protein [Nocardioides sp. GY 10113]TIC86768.1 hypothetical protein E8D34_11030 [Nocardioides sp. GY 10113]
MRLTVRLTTIVVLLGLITALAPSSTAAVSRRAPCAFDPSTGYTLCYQLLRHQRANRIVESVVLRNTTDEPIEKDCLFHRHVRKLKVSGRTFGVTRTAVFRLVKRNVRAQVHRRIVFRASTPARPAATVSLDPGQVVTCSLTYQLVAARVRVRMTPPGGGPATTRIHRVRVPIRFSVGLVA